MKHLKTIAVIIIYFEKSKNKTTNGITTNCKWFGADSEIDDDELPF